MTMTKILSRKTCYPYGHDHLKIIRPVSEYCSARVSRVGLSTEQATEPYSDNLLSRTRNPSEPYSDKEIPFRRALRRLLSSLDSQLGMHRKLGFSPLGTVPETVLGHLLNYELRSRRPARK